LEKIIKSDVSFARILKGSPVYTNREQLLSLRLYISLLQKNNMKPSTAYISNLTPLRGFAALIVVIFHFEALIGKFVNENNSMFINKGYMMVDLFFVMSGFIIFHVYRSNFRNSITGQSFRKFLIARFARIYPLHFIMLLICVLLIFVLGANPILNPAAIPTHIFLLQSFGIHKIFTLNVPS